MKTKFSSRQCPQSAERANATREVFGEDCKVTWIEENEFTYGQDERERDRRFNELASIIPSAVPPTKEQQ